MAIMGGCGRVFHVGAYKPRRQALAHRTLHGVSSAMRCAYAQLREVGRVFHVARFTGVSFVWVTHGLCHGLAVQIIKRTREFIGDSQEKVMSDGQKGQGQCLCGHVGFKAESASPHTGACHCAMCVKWGGGPLLAVDCGSDVSFSGEENITRYSSSEWAERGFCQHCGTHLFYRLKGINRYTIPAGLFDEQSGFQMTHQIFIDKKPAHYNFSNETENMTEAEVFAKYAPPE